MSAATMNPRTMRLLHGAIVPTLLGMAWPNILVMLAQASTGLIETWFVSRLGVDALAGMALVLALWFTGGCRRRRFGLGSGFGEGRGTTSVSCGVRALPVPLTRHILRVSRRLTRGKQQAQRMQRIRPRHSHA